MRGLILVPTPIQEDHPLETVARERLLRDCMDEKVLILVEEHKVARQRWLRWGLPREAIERFILFNEHSQEKILPEILKGLQSGQSAYLLSDCGLPAFCDPGQLLVDACHRKGILVTATPFANSVALTVALSGFPHKSFVFSGFVPIREPDRKDWMKKELKRPEALIWMDTPYRLKKLLDELSAIPLLRDVFLGCDLGAENELLLRGPVKDLLRKLDNLDKREFVMMIAPF